MQTDQPFPTTSFRRACRGARRGAGALALGGLLLAGAAACGDSGGDSTTTAPAAETSSSAAPASPSAAPSATDSASPSASASADPSTDPAGSKIQIAFSDPLDDTTFEYTGDSATVSAETVQSSLDAAVGGSGAACDGTLSLAAGSDVHCTVQAAPEGDPVPQDVTAYPVFGPQGTALIAFAVGGPLSPEARDALYDGQNEVTWLGQGGMYGAEPIPADQLVGDVQSVLDSQNALLPNDWGLTVSSCAGDLDFSTFAPVTCTAEVAGSGGVMIDARVLPGALWGNEPGLIVSADNQTDI